MHKGLCLRHPAYRPPRNVLVRNSSTSRQIQGICDLQLTIEAAEKIAFGEIRIVDDDSAVQITIRLLLSVPAQRRYRQRRAQRMAQFFEAAILTCCSSTSS